MNTLNWHALNWFDFAIIATILLSVIISFARGFLREIVSLIIWVVAILVAFKFAPLLGNIFSKHIDSPSVRYILAFVLIIFAVIIVGMIINAIIKAVVRRAGLSVADRTFGILFGAARGLLLVALILMFINMSSLQKSPWVTSSQLTPYFKPFVTWLSKFLPQEMKHISEWMSNSVKTVNIDYNKANAIQNGVEAVKSLPN